MPSGKSWERKKETRGGGGKKKSQNIVPELEVLYGNPPPKREKSRKRRGPMRQNLGPSDLTAHEMKSCLDASDVSQED